MCVCVCVCVLALIAVVLTWHILQVEAVDLPKSDIHYRSVQGSTKHNYDVCKTSFINSRILCYLPFSWLPAMVSGTQASYDLR